MATAVRDFQERTGNDCLVRGSHYIRTTLAPCIRTTAYHLPFSAEVVRIQSTTVTASVGSVSNLD
jgi:hypothetical protein